MCTVLFQEAETVFQQAGELSIGCVVQVDDPPRYGVLQWIGTFPGSDEMRAGIELVRFLSLVI